MYEKMIVVLCNTIRFIVMIIPHAVCSFNKENLFCPGRQKMFLCCERARKSAPKQRKNAEKAIPVIRTEFRWD